MSAHENAAAFFDLDGTLLASPSLERRFVAAMIRRGEIESHAGARWVARTARLLWEDVEPELPRDAEHLSRSESPREDAIRRDPPITWTEVVAENKTYLRGLRVSLLEGWIAEQDFTNLAVFPAALARIAWHAAHGHPIFLVSGTLAPLARCVAQKLVEQLAPGTEIGVRATELGAWNERFTGEISGRAMTAEEKFRGVSLATAALRLDLSRSYAYGNSLADLPMLACVGRPCAVNPSFALAWAARRRKWPVLRWDADGLHGRAATADSNPTLRRARFAMGRRP